MVEQTALWGKSSGAADKYEGTVTRVVASINLIGSRFSFLLRQDSSSPDRCEPSASHSRARVLHGRLARNGSEAEASLYSYHISYMRPNAFPFQCRWWLLLRSPVSTGPARRRPGRGTSRDAVGGLAPSDWPHRFFLVSYISRASQSDLISPFGTRTGPQPFPPLPNSFFHHFAPCLRTRSSWV